jgi:hypothetical protein
MKMLQLKFLEPFCHISNNRGKMPTIFLQINTDNINISKYEIS